MQKQPDNNNNSTIDKQVDKKLDESQQYYLSSLDEQSQVNEKQNIQVEESLSYGQRALKLLKSLFLYCLSILFFVVFLTPLYGTITIFIPCFMAIKSQVNCRITMFSIWMGLCTFSTVYTQIIYYFFKIENQNVEYVLQDGVFFYMTQIMVICFIKMNTSKLESFSDLLSAESLLKSVGTLQYNGDQNLNAYYFDYTTQINSIEDREQILQGYPQISKSYSFFKQQFQKYSDGEYRNLLFRFNIFIQPNFYQFFILILIILIKLTFTFLYVIWNDKELSNKETFNLTITIFLYIYTTFNLNRLLGNNDLIRRQNMMNNLNELVDFKVDFDPNIVNKLDITCPISLETWDNTRKFLFNLERENLQILEKAYFFFLFYFVFVSMIALSVYFELYWIIPEKSYLLQPVIAIMSSFNFIFLTCFLFFRFYQGNKLNDTFGDMEQNITYLVDVFEDFQSLFDEFFFYEDNIKRVPKEKKNSVYGLLIKKIKLLSKHYIQNKIKYSGILYEKGQKTILRKTMIQTMKSSLEKIRKSVQTDSQLYPYKFLNIIEINFNDILFTFTFAIVTSLPTIAPKFIAFYSAEQ